MANDGGNHGLRGKLNEINDSLDPPKRARIVDPELCDELDLKTNPEPAPQTTDPHRVSFWVPTPDHTLLSLGEAAKAVDRNLDKGIRGRTDTFIGWKVNGTGPGAPLTMMILGSPTKEGFKGFGGGDSLGKNKGFAMVTEGQSWMDAAGQMYFVSRAGQITVRAAVENIRLQADTADVELMARRDVSIGAAHYVRLAANPSLVATASGHATPHEPSWSDTDVKAQKKWMTFLDLAATAQGLYTSLKKFVKKGKKGKRGWQEDPNGVAKFLVDGAKAYATYSRLELGKVAPGQVKIDAETFAGMAGGIAASMYGTQSASVTSLVSASVLGATAGLKGLAWTSVWAGLGLSLKTLAGKADMKSEHGKASVSGAKGVAIASGDEGVEITGKKDAQLNSTDGKAFVHGKNGAYFGCGDEDGFGVNVRAGKLEMGNFTAASTFGSPSLNSEARLLMTKKATHIKHGDSQLTLSQYVMKVKAIDSVEIKASGNASFDGNKILIG
jgi:hypothetical protein